MNARSNTLMTLKGRWKIAVERVSRAIAPSLISLFAFASTAVLADTITVAPSNPNASQPFAIRVDGVSAVSMAYVITSSQLVQGQVIRLEACTNDLGFQVPGTYFVLYSFSSLPAGAYLIEYYHATCATDGKVIQPYQQTASRAVVVSGGLSEAPIPTLSGPALAVLTAALLVELALIRRQRRRSN